MKTNNSIITSLFSRISGLFSWKSQPQTPDKVALSDYLYSLVGKNVIDFDQYSMIEGILQFSNLRVRDIMVSRAQMVTLDANARLDACIPTVVSSQHSRFPVIEKNIDNVKGLVLAKDLLQHLYETDSRNVKIYLHEIARPAIFVPESKRLDSLLREFQSTHNHMAIVIDEYGGVSGLITIEDVIEQITGEIEDEHDHNAQKQHIHQVSENTFLVDALTPVEDFNEHFHTDISPEYFDTIGGIVAQKFGCVPKPGEACQYNDLTFKIVHSTNRQIKSLEITTTKNETN
ncbi:MAG: transporter associated domain-containing protein [Pseudomonadota bacterium]|nr:transporter associated domain-containing protein [Pseudomonadota bacterium]